MAALNRVDSMNYQRPRILAVSLALMAALPPLGAGADVGGQAPSSSPTLKLEGHAEVQQIQRDMQAWQASQTYRQGAYLMSVKDYASAADAFKQAGDGFLASLGEGKFCAESRFAEAQCRRLMGQKARSAELFQIALDMFRNYDPHNPFLKAAQAYVDQSQGGSPKLHGHTAKLASATSTAVPTPIFRPSEGFVDPNIRLTANVTTLQGGVKEDDIFTGSKMYAEQPTAADISDKFVHDTVYKAFLEMNCLEMAALGGNYYTAPESYKSLKASGKSLVIGGADSTACPQVTMKLNGRDYPIQMNLPGISKGRKNVLVATDGLHVVAIDPQTNETWRLVPQFSKQGADFNWAKLTHKKDPRAFMPPPPRRKGKPVKSLFAR